VPALAVNSGGVGGAGAEAGRADGRALVTLMLLAGLAGCRTSPSEPLTAAGVVRCPSLLVEASSFDVVYGGSIELTAGPADSSGDPAIAYQWSGNGGQFSDAKGRVTTYRCSAGAGPRTIAVTARRASCSVATSLVIVCEDESVDAGVVDAAGHVAPDDARETDSGNAASDGAADAGGVCGPDPTIDEAAACNQCTLANCTIFENVKKDVMPTAGCHHLAADRDRQACEALYCCMRTNRCVVNGDPTPCWCGTADPSRCATGADVANGPCLAETQAAAGTKQQPEIAASVVDPTLAIGGAVNLAICRASFCADPPKPACAGF
jgi:hypothetical protein